MTNSFQSTAFQSSASPVDTFVRPPSVQPKTDLEELAEALQSINPSIQTFIGSRLEKAVEREEAEGTELAIEDAAKNFKDISRGVKKADGEDAARQLIGGSIFADRAYQRTKAEILGSNLASTLSNSYATTQVDGKSLNAFSLQSPQFQTWLEGERSKVVDQLSDVNPTYVNKYFLPKLADATAIVTSSHIKQHQEYNLEKLKNLAVPLVKGLIVSDDETDLQLITNFEQSMNNLGLVTKDRSDLNKTIVGVLIDQAEAVGLSGDGDIEAAEDILDIALKFPYGVDGKLNLTAHPDYQGKVNTLKKQINDYMATQAKRRKIEKERLKEEDIVNTFKTFAETGDASLITNLQKKYPLEAPKIGNAGVALDGNTRERSAQLEARIIGDGFESKKDAANAALSWYLDERTPKTQANRTRLSQLLGVANSSENGDFSNLNKMLSELNSQLKGEFSGSDFIIGTTGQLNDKGSSAVNDIFNAAKLESIRYVLGEGKGVDPLTEIEKLEKIKQNALEKARKKANPFKDLINNNNLQPNNEKKEQNLDDIEGDANTDAEAGAFTPSTPEDEARERKLNQTEKLDEILKGVDKTKKIPQTKINEMLLAVGFTPEQAKIMAAVAMAESAGDPIIDTVKSGLDPEKKNEFSIGLFQLNMIDAFLEERLKLFGIESTDELYNPIVNVIAAKRLYDQQGFGAWSAYNNDSYKKFLTD
jgi:ribosomal 30S subunit maturation factor RimM